MGQRICAAEHAKDPQLYFRMAGGIGLAGFHCFVGLSDGKCYFDPGFDAESGLCADCVVSYSREEKKEVALLICPVIFQSLDVPS